MRVEDQGAHLPSGFEVGSMKLVKIRQDPMIISKLTLLEGLIRVNKGCKKSANQSQSMTRNWSKL